MRNYFKQLNLPVTASFTQIESVLQSELEMVSAIDTRHRADAHEVLLDEERSRLYASLAELYERLNWTSACLESPPGIDSHRWRDRLAEFGATDDIAATDDPADLL